MRRTKAHEAFMKCTVGAKKKGLFIGNGEVLADGNGLLSSGSINFTICRFFTIYHFHNRSFSNPIITRLFPPPPFFFLFLPSLSNLKIPTPLSSSTLTDSRSTKPVCFDAGLYGTETKTPLQRSPLAGPRTCQIPCASKKDPFSFSKVISTIHLPVHFPSRLTPPPLWFITPIFL